MTEHTEALQNYIENAESCKQFTEVQVIVAPGYIPCTRACAAERA